MRRLLVLILLCTAPLILRGNGQLRLSQEESEWLKNHHSEVVLWYNTDFPPIEFANEEGQFIGLGAEVFRLIEDNLGYQFRKESQNDWNRHLRGLKSGECHIAPVIVKSEERSAYILFTEYFASVPVVIITFRDYGSGLTLEDLGGMRVAVVSGFVSESYLKEAAPEDTSIVRVATVDEGIRAVAFGQVDAFVENLAVASYTISRNGITNLKIAGITEKTFDFGIGISKNYPLLFSAINKALAAIPGEKLVEVKNRWISLEMKNTLSEKTLLIIRLSVLFSAILIISLLVISFLLKAQLKRRLITLGEAQQQLVESEGKYRSFFMDAPLPLAEYDIRNGTAHFNHALTRVFGYTERDFTSLDSWWTQLFPEQSIRDKIRREWDRGVERLRVGKPPGVDREFLVPCKNGEKKSVMVKTNLVAERLLISIHDLTELKRAQEGIRIADEKLRQSQKMDAIGQLAGGISHDFNNVLGGIIGAAELLNMEVTDDRSRSFVQLILKSSQRAAELIQKLLVFSKKRTIGHSAISILNPLKQAIDIVSQTIDKRISIEKHFGPEQPVVEGDASQLQTAFMNLMINASHAMPRGGRLEIRVKILFLDAEYCRLSSFPIQAGDYVSISFKDTGHGIPSEHLEKIFDPFFTTKPEGKGTGLGLSLVFGTIQQHNGAIQVSSEVNVGTEFIVLLPLSKKSPVPVQVSDNQYVPGEGTVLLVDDEEAVVETASRTLEQIGYRVFTCRNGKDAISLFRQRHQDIDLVILDMIMPEMNGYDCFFALKEIDSEVRVLLASGYTRDKDVSRMMNSGLKGFINKPFNGYELSRIVHQVLTGS